MPDVPLWRRYARFFGVDVKSDVEEELRFHLEAKARDLIDRGVSPERARAEALREFGDIAGVRRLCEASAKSRERTIDRRHYWSGWGQDLRYAGRTLRKTPIVTVIAVVSIALGIGANTAIFTLFDQVLLRKLPVAEADRLVRVETTGYFHGSTDRLGARAVASPVPRRPESQPGALRRLWHVFVRRGGQCRRPRGIDPV